MKLILASTSPRRKTILSKLGIPFDIIHPNVDEKIISSKLPPDQYSIQIAKLKCDAISNIKPNCLVIGADTIVVLDGLIIGKPENKLDAKKILQSLSGRNHQVYTGVYFKLTSKQISYGFYEKTNVKFHTLNKYEIDLYIREHKPFDKAGSYGIQDLSAIFVETIKGCYDNVVGFPLSRFYKECDLLNINLLDSIS